MSAASPPPTPPPGRPRLLKDVAGFAGSQYVLRFATLVKGFVVARILGPEGNGLWQHFVIISEYAQYSHLGALTGLSKALGHKVGAGDEAGAEAARNNGMAAIVGAAGLLWLAMIAYVIMRRDTLASYDLWGLPVLGFIVLLEQVNFTYQAILRAYSRIKIISVVATVFAFANLAVSLALLPKYKVLGLLIGWAITRLGTTVWLARRSGFPIRPRFDAAMLRLLFATGLPIFFFHVTRVGLRNIDRVLVDSVLDKSQLGIYGIAVTLAGLIRYVADAIGFVVYPIFLRTYGETRDPQALAGHLVRPTEFLSLFVPTVLGVSWLVLHLPILWLLPDYVPSIDIYRLLTFQMAFSCLAILPGFYLMAIDRQNWLVPLGVLIVAFDFFVGRGMIERGYGLGGVAATMGAGALVYCTAVLAYAGSFALGSLGKVTAWIGKIYLPTLYSAAAVFVIRTLVPHTPLVTWSETARALAEGAAFLLVSLPWLVLYEKRHGVLASLKRRGGARRDD